MPALPRRVLTVPIERRPSLTRALTLHFWLHITTTFTPRLRRVSHLMSRTMITTLVLTFLGVHLPLSSSLIVTVVVRGEPRATPPVGFDSTTVNDSVGSLIRSSTTGTEIHFTVSPGWNVTVPVVAV